MPVEPNYRRCVSCRQIAHRNDLLRVVRTYPTGTVKFNQGVGRSAYICRQADCLHSAHKKNRLGRSLKTFVPDVIYQQLDQTIKEAVQSPE